MISRSLTSFRRTSTRASLICTMSVLSPTKHDVAPRWMMPLDWRSKAQDREMTLIHEGTQSRMDCPQGQPLRILK